MPILYIEEYADLLEDATGAKMQATDEIIDTDRLSIGAASNRSLVNFAQNTRFLVLVSDTACQYELGDDTVVADLNSRYLPANLPRVVAVRGNSTRIAVIEQQP